MADSSTLLSEIEAFLAIPHIGISATRFGIEAVNDSKFVSELKNGRRMWPETVAKVREYMERTKRERIIALGGIVPDEPSERAA